MEAKTTKMIAAVAVIVMCAAGLVGAGYAYTASTVNDGNSASSEYITLVQGGTGAYQFVTGQNVYWDSTDKMIKSNGDALHGKQAYNVNGEGRSAIAVDDMVTQYKLSQSVNTTAITDLTLVKLGDSFTLNPTSNLTTGRPAITIAVTAENLALPADGEIWMKVTGGDPSPQYFKLTLANTFTKYTDATHASTGNEIIVAGGGENTYSPLTVEMYYGFLTDTYDGVLSKHASGAAPVVKPATSLLNNAKLIFTVDVAKANDFHFTAASIDVTNAVTVDFSESLILPAGYDGDVEWTSSDTDTATVDEETGVVTAAATGTCVITATITVNEVEISTTVIANVTVTP